MKGLLDIILKASIVVGIAVGSSSIAYYYLIYLPHRDATIDAERKAREIEVKNSRLQEERSRAAEKLRIQNEKDLAINRYELCKIGASTNYNGDWDNTCAQFAEEDAKAQARCKINNEVSYCIDKFKIRPSKDCTLPQITADRFQKRVDEAKTRCLQEFQAGAR